MFSILSVAAAGVFIWHHLYTQSFLLLLLAAFAAAPSAVLNALTENRTLVLAGIAIFAFLLTFTIGVHRATSILDSTSPTEQIMVDDRAVPARLIRGGDKGVLFYVVETKNIRFVRWDSIKQIQTN
jgi:hypothetical protein